MAADQFVVKAAQLNTYDKDSQDFGSLAHGSTHTRAELEAALGGKGRVDQFIADKLLVPADSAEAEQVATADAGSNPAAATGDEVDFTAMSPDELEAYSKSHTADDLAKYADEHGVTLVTGLTKLEVVEALRDAQVAKAGGSA